MKPLSEWTTDELLDVMQAYPDATVTPREALAELLRRERERCAAAVDAVRGKYSLLPEPNANECSRMDGLELAIVTIRGLQ